MDSHRESTVNSGRVASLPSCYSTAIRMRTRMNAQRIEIRSPGGFNVAVDGEGHSFEPPKTRALHKLGPSIAEQDKDLHHAP